MNKLQCKICGKKYMNNNLKQCGGCNNIIYCSKQCQFIDWTKNNHRENCIGNINRENKYWYDNKYISGDVDIFLDKQKKETQTKIKKVLFIKLLNKHPSIKIEKEIREFRVYLISRHNKEKKILRLFYLENFNIPQRSIKDTINTYLDFSDLKITPHVYSEGTIIVGGEKKKIKFRYIITDYFTKTLSDIWNDKKLNRDKKDQIYYKAIKIAEKIESLGYYRQDAHQDNFLYDEENHNVYAIDFDRLTKNPEDLHFQGYIPSAERFLSEIWLPMVMGL